MENQICQYISKSKIIPVTHSFSTSLLCRNLADPVSHHKKLEAAHHRWLRQILNISWKDKVTNVKVRELTGMPTLEDIIRERRLRWAGHIWMMPNNALARTALNWTPKESRVGPEWTGLRR